MKQSERDFAHPSPGTYLLTVSLAQQAEMALVRARDWLGMVRYGVNHFLVFRVAGIFGVGLAGAAAQMRGETLEEFKRTRHVWEER